MAPTTLTERSAGCGFSPPIQRKTERSLEGRAQHPEQARPLLQRRHQAVDPRQIGRVGLGEQAGDALGVERVGALLLFELGEGGAEDGDELGLDRPQLRVGEAAGDHPGAQRPCR